jgi:putative colanic acid biosynthesis UDP-glucose lipid carrier transferase
MDDELTVVIASRDKFAVAIDAPEEAVPVRARWNAESLVSLPPHPLPVGNRVVPTRSPLLNLARAVTDPLGVIVAFVTVVRLGGIPADERLGSFAAVTFVVLLAGGIPGRASVSRSTLSCLARSAIVAGVLLLAASHTGYLHIAVGTWVVEWPLLAAGLIVGTHRSMDYLAPRIASLHSPRRMAAIVGATLAGSQLAAQFRNDRNLNTEFIGYYDDRTGERVGDRAREVVGGIDQVAQMAREGRIDVVYIAFPMTRQRRLLHLLHLLRDTTASVYFVPDIFVGDFVQAWPSDVNGIPVLAVCETPFSGMNDVLKRASDIAIAATLLVALGPLLAAIALCVAIGSRGPVIFKQRRYGVDGREILVWKFRSMTVTEDGAVVIQARRGDPRVTRLGAVLRKYSLDELPQLFNVLQGRMSMVGPRPHAVAHNEQYRKLIDGYMLRHKVRPGLSGLAQVNGCRGETDTVAKMRRRVEYDLMYLRCWTLQLDLYIILKTVVMMWKDPKGY